MEKDLEKNINKDLKKHGKGYLRLYLTGFTMGTADLIPGVSGGTVAFISGIYEELLYSIKLLSGEVLRKFLQFQFKEAILLIPFRFLVPLALGLFTAVLSLAKLLSWLLSEYPTFVWAFFFGLVLASTYIVLKRVVKWDLSDKVSFIVSAIAAYIIVGLVPVETPATLLMFFLSGMIAIIAMILPGISGSFILVILGKYEQVLHAVTSRDFLSIGIFILGTILGLSLFARFLTWLFARHHDISIAILAGFMLGSLRKIWPWKEVVTTRINSKGIEVPVVENNILPASFDISVIIAILLILVAIFLVVYLEKIHVVKDQAADIEDPEFKKEHKEALQSQKN